jgi:drug/metabolite transporter (DMT)-like permease
MNRALTPATVVMLVIPPILWAGNAIVGRAIHGLVSPVTLNFFRSVTALLIVLPLAASIYRQGSGFATHWRRFAVLGLLGIGIFNTLQYLALQSTTPINVTLVAASMPFMMLALGGMFFGVSVARKQVLGAVLSIIGVLVVLCRGEWSQLMALRATPGDIYILIATFLWSAYSWILMRFKEEHDLRWNWAGLLVAQLSFGVLWSGLFAAAEWVLVPPQVDWGWPMAAGLLFVALGPAIIAFGLWGVGVQRVGPGIAGFFANLTPIFAALLSTAFLGEMPQLYHVAAFALIVGGIVLSSWRQVQPTAQGRDGPIHPS